MIKNPAEKYKAFQVAPFAKRTWPDCKITQAPRWCSTDLRDGNQALANPMDQARKAKFYALLIQCGFKEIEVGFPAASQTDFDFVRHLIDAKLIPADVNIQVMTQARPDLIQRSFEALIGAQNATVHLYNATAEVFRRIVFDMTKAEVIDLAVSSTRLIRQLCDDHPETKWTLQYSPETFCFTEAEFALEICEAVTDVWHPSDVRPLIINLPTTIEVATPNVFADQIEWFCQNFSRRKDVCISVHPHNDRGTATATAELALMAGADRVEGCLFGNGERTGNVDLVNLALNMYSQGIHPNLDFSQIQNVAKVVSDCNELPIHPRHPYAGELVFTAFSGSHQDAIKKGFQARKIQQHDLWEVPYLAIDPQDLGCDYQAVIRVNSQSGKSGAAWILQQNHGIELPHTLQRHFSGIIQSITDTTAQELSAAEIWHQFRASYGVDQKQLNVTNYQVVQITPQQVKISINLSSENLLLPEQPCEGVGNGLLSAALNAMQILHEEHLEIIDFQERSLGQSAQSRSICLVLLSNKSGIQQWGIAIDTDISRASITALINAVYLLNQSPHAIVNPNRQ